MIDVLQDLINGAIINIFLYVLNDFLYVMYVLNVFLYGIRFFNVNSTVKQTLMVV